MQTTIQNPGRTAAIILTLGIFIAALAPTPAPAKDEAPVGFFIGLDAGAGGSSVTYQDGRKNISEDAVGGGLGGLRIGYAMSPKLALSLEGHGFHRADDDNEWNLNATVIAVTWRPWGSGFFLRAGAGLGRGDYRPLDAPATIELDERLAGTFAVGYDWRLGEHASLGLAASGFGMEAGNTTGFDDDSVGAGGLTAQFTWHP